MSHLSKKNNDPAKLWEAILGKLQETMHNESFLTWFQPLAPIALDNNKLTLGIPNRFHHEWIDSHYMSILNQAVKDTHGVPLDISFKIDPNGQLDLGVEDKPERLEEDVSRIKNEQAKSHLNPAYLFDNFIEGDCNRLARAASLALAKTPGKTPFNPLLLYGGPGLGKTHLIQAIGNYILQNDPHKRVYFVTGEQFTSDFIMAIQSNRAENFKRLYRNIDVLLLDDVQFFLAKEKTQDAFFHTFNALHHAGKQLVFSSDRSPQDLEGFEKRLVTRLQLGLVTELQTPDYETRSAIIEYLSIRENLKLSDEIIDLIASHLKENIRSIHGMITQLSGHSLLLKREMTIELVKEELRKLTNQPFKAASIETIQEVVSKELGVDPDDIRSKSRKKEVVEARHIAMYLSKELTNHTLKSIGFHFGGMDHASIIHGKKRINKRMENESDFSELISRLRRKIELSSM